MTKWISAAADVVAFAAIAAFVLFRERLGRLQVLGIALVVTGVAVLAGLSA